MKTYIWNFPNFYRSAIKVRKNYGGDIYISSSYCRPQTKIETIDLDIIADIIGTKEAICRRLERKGSNITGLARAKSLRTN